MWGEVQVQVCWESFGEFTDFILGRNLYIYPDDLPTNTE